MSQAPQELERTTAQVQMDAINVAMMRWAVWADGKNIVRKGRLSKQEMETAGQIMLVAAQVDQHFQKQGSLDGLKVCIGSCLTTSDQDFYVRNSLISGLIDQKDMEGLNIRSISRWSSTVEGLEIRREDLGGRFGYFLAAKEPRWVEED